MKKSVLFLLSVLMASASAFAQPAFPDIKFQEVLPGQDGFNGADVYLYNVEAKMFLGRGNNWGAHAILGSSEGTGGTNYSLAQLIQGKGTVEGYRLTLSEAKNQTGLPAELSDAAVTWTIHPDAPKAGFMTPYGNGGSKDGPWMDSGTDAVKIHDSWFFTEKDNTAHTFKICALDKNIKDNDTTYVSVGFLGAKKFADGDINVSIDSLTDYTTWAIVSKTDYEEILAGLQAYYAGKGLKDLVDTAKVYYPEADYSAYETMLSEATADYAEYLEAIGILLPRVELAKALKDVKDLDATRDWGKYEEIFASTTATTDEVNTAVTYLKALITLKKALNEAAALDSERGYAEATLWSSDDSEVAAINDAVAKVNSYIALKKAINEGSELDAEHSYASSQDIYEDDTKTKAEIDAETARVKAFISLKKAINAAVAEYPTIDLTDPISAYNNSASTATELAAAEAAVADAVKLAYLEEAMKEATADNPMDLTQYIVNPTFDTIGDFTGWTPATTEKDNKGWGAGGTTSTNAEVYGRSFDIYQDITGMPAGVYMVSCNGYTRYQNIQTDYDAWAAGQVSETKIYLKGETYGQFFTPIKHVAEGGSKTSFPDSGSEVTAQAKDEYGTTYTLYTPNTMAAADYYFHKTGEGGGNSDRYLNEAWGNKAAGDVLRIGVINQKATGTDWSIFDDFKLMFYGDGADAYQKWGNAVATANAITPNYPYGKPEKDYYDNVMAELNAASDKDAVAAAIAKVDKAVDTLAVTSRANYAAYVETLKKASEWLTTVNPDDVADDNDAFWLFDSYMEAESAADAEGYELPNGPANVILPNWADGGFEGILSAAEIAKETAFLDSIYQSANRNTLMDGSDLTDLLTNPAFDTNNWTGWEHTAASGGNVRVAEKCCEAWNNSAFDISQEVAGLPDGLYEISVQGFYRYGRNEYQHYVDQDVSFVKPGGAPVYVYMNNMSTPFANVYDQPQGSGFYPSGSQTAGGNYFPNDMASAAKAFGEGMYTQKAFGLVKAGEVMRVGVKGNSSQLGDSWVIFDNFKLTYRAKNPEAVAAVLDQKSKELGKLIYVTDADGNPTSTQTDEFLTTLSRIQTKAKGYYQQSQEIAGLTDDEKYDVMVNVNDIYNEVKANIQTQKDITDAKAQYDVAMNALIALDPQGDLGSKDLYILTDDMDDNLYPNRESLTSDAELRTLCDSLITLTSMVNKEVEKIKVAGATDDEPLDMTSRIVNPALDTKNADGWTVGNLGQNNGYQDNNTYTNGEVSLNQFIECWRNGAVLDNGTIEQTLKSLPAGTYTLTADVMAKRQMDASVDVTGLFLFVMTPDSTYTKVEASTQDVSPKRYDVTFKLEAETDVTIGLQALNTNGNWLGADNFKLTCFGTESQKEPTAIDFIEVQPAAFKRNGKFFENGQLIIYRNGKKYNVAGQQLQ